MRTHTHTHTETPYRIQGHGITILSSGLRCDVTGLSIKHLKNFIPPVLEAIDNHIFLKFSFQVRISVMDGIFRHLKTVAAPSSPVHMWAVPPHPGAVVSLVLRAPWKVRAPVSHCCFGKCDGVRKPSHSEVLFPIMLTII